MGGRKSAFVCLCNILPVRMNLQLFCTDLHITRRLVGATRNDRQSWQGTRRPHTITANSRHKYTHLKLRFFSRVRSDPTRPLSKVKSDLGPT